MKFELMVFAYEKNFLPAVALFGLYLLWAESIGIIKRPSLPDAYRHYLFFIDDSTYYESKAMFQFEDQGREYLCFQNNRNRGVSRLIVFDIENECVYKSVPLYKDGPDGIPSVFGAFPLDMERF